VTGRVATRLVVAALAALALAGCAQPPDCPRIAGVRPGLCPLPEELRRPAPDVALPLLAHALEAGQVGRPGATADGAALSLADLQGRVVVLNFWASWCGPCRIEQPDLNEAARLLPSDEVLMLGVNIEDSEANALAHLREFAVPYSSLFDPVNALAGRFDGIGARTIPTTVFLDVEGRVAARVLGVTTLGEIVGLADALALEAALARAGATTSAP
jgi:thiol-disulfide isomerase/thioredoxin